MYISFLISYCHALKVFSAYKNALQKMKIKYGKVGQFSLNIKMLCKNEEKHQAEHLLFLYVETIDQLFLTSFSFFAWHLYMQRKLTNYECMAIRNENRNKHSGSTIIKISPFTLHPVVAISSSNSVVRPHI